MNEYQNFNNYNSESNGQDSNSYYQGSNPYGNNGMPDEKESKREKRRKARKEKMQSNSFGVKLAKVAAVALVFGLVAGVVFQGASYATAKVLGIDTKEETVAASTLSKSNKVDSTAVSTATTVSDVSDIVENVMPSIVAVTNISYTEYRSFFGGTRTYENESAGSGIIISQDKDNLYIASNNHVVAGAETLTITFDDGTAVPATVKGTDASVDLAVVSVSLSDVDKDTLSKIKVATIGESKDLVVGESAIVIGNALGYGQSVTTGVISALSRDVELEDESGNTITNQLLQTDAAVNPGNSGGALLNMKGEVVGIVSAKYADTAVEGMGYAIPMSRAESIIETMINQQVVSEGEAAYLGIAGVDVTNDVAMQYDMPTGVYVSKVVEKSGADKAGIKKGDVITSFNGRSVSSMEEIMNMMQYIKAGTEVDVTVAQASNGYEETTLKVTLTKKMKN